MNTIRRLLYVELALTITYVCLGFLALFLFFDMVGELASVGIANYHLLQASAFVALQIPGHLYELLPIGVLIGSVLVMARFAQSSEFTVLRTSGLSPKRGLSLLMWLGFGFVVFTFIVGDYLAPQAHQMAQLLKAKYQNTTMAAPMGAWLKQQQGNKSYALNVGALDGNGHMRQIRIFEFSPDARILRSTQAVVGEFVKDAWLLKEVKITQFPTTPPIISLANTFESVVIQVENFSEYHWPTEINSAMVSAALLKPERMPLQHLYRYIDHLNQNGQASQIYEIEFWRKLFYPFSCLVMLMLALPFAYLHIREEGIAGYVFLGIVTGISFFLLNNVFSYIGNISHWRPWLAAVSPSLIYSSISAATFFWIVYKK